MGLVYKSRELPHYMSKVCISRFIARGLHLHCWGLVLPHQRPAPEEWLHLNSSCTSVPGKNYIASLSNMGINLSLFPCLYHHFASVRPPGCHSRLTNGWLMGFFEGRTKLGRYVCCCRCTQLQKGFFRWWAAACLQKLVTRSRTWIIHTEGPVEAMAAEGVRQDLQSRNH